MSKEMLINTVEGKECRIAVVEDGTLEELYVERVSTASKVGNIYKGRITNVESSIQAAFVDFGTPKNGFLHVSDLHPSYFPKASKSRKAQEKRRSRVNRPPIQECLRRGQEVVVQVTKEGIGTKGPTMTTYLSIPGRLLVMMPGLERKGVSRKIEDEQERNSIRKILDELKTPPDIGFIVRTAAVGRPQRDFNRDLNYLLRLWKSVKKRINDAKAPAEIYQESDLVTRTIRDVYNTDIARVVCDNLPVARKVREFLNVAMPRTKHVIEMYTGREGLFHDYGVEQEIERIYSRKVEMPSGGSLVIDQTEALVAIDVNSGRFRAHSDAETTATKINELAAKEIVRQLRLRDLGGVIVMDFIDMRHDKNCRSVEKVLRDELKRDRAKTKVLKMSSFGIVEMTRQRVRPSLKHSIYRTCAQCEGSGLIKSEESQSLMVLRTLQRAVSNEDVTEARLNVTPRVADYLSNEHRRELAKMEAEYGKHITIRGDDSLPGGGLEITCFNNRGSEVACQTGGDGRRPEKVDTMALEKYESSRPKEKEERPESKPESRPESDKAGEQPGKDSGGGKSGGGDGGRGKSGGDGGGRGKSGGDSEKSDDGGKSNQKGDQPKKRKSRRRGSRGGRKHRKNKSKQSGQDNSGGDKGDDKGNDGGDDSKGKGSDSDNKND